MYFQWIYVAWAGPNKHFLSSKTSSVTISHLPRRLQDVFKAVTVIKICLGTSFNIKSYHSETVQLICKAINWLVSIWHEFSEQTIAQSFFVKDMVIFKKQSNIGSLKIPYSLTFPFRLNSSKRKALYWVECYENCYICFNCLLPPLSFLI